MRRDWCRAARCMARLWSYWLIAASVCLPAFAADDQSSLAGVYRDDRLVVELSAPNRADDQTSYTGVIQLGEQKFPLKASADETRLTGTFHSQGDDFDFSAVVVGGTLVLTTDGTTYRLKKQSRNPLSRRPATPNPLTQSRTNSSPVVNPEAEVNKPAAVPRTSPLRMRRQSVADDPSMIGGAAFSVLLPADWHLEGGVSWRMHPALPASATLRVSNESGTERLEMLPVIPFVWVDGGIPLFPAGSIYMGNEVAEPMDDPVAYIKQVIFARFRRTLLTPQISAMEELPRLAEFLAEASREPGVQKKFRAARMRLEYLENGKTMEEDIYCVVTSTYLPATRTTYWGADRNYSFRAEKGKLEGRTPMFQAILNSFKPHLAWFNRYQQLLQLLAQNQIDCTRPPSDLSRYIAATSFEITEARRQNYEWQQASQERLNRFLSQLILGLADYRDPFDKRIVQLPSGYPGAWAHPGGDYLLSENREFDPNAGGGKEWRRLER